MTIKSRVSRRFFPLIILAVGIAGFLLLKLSRPEPQTVGVQERSWQVDVMPVHPTSHVPVLALYGELVAPERQRITASLSGRIAERPVKEGQTVSEGDLLVALDQQDIQPRLVQANADVQDLAAQIESESVRHKNDLEALDAEKAILANARRQFQRTQSLVERNLASREALEAASDALARARLTVTARERAIAEHPARLGSLEARLARAEASLASVQLDADRSQIAAPFDGIVTDIQVAPGDRVSAQSPLLSFYPASGLELRATVPDRYRSELLAALNDGKTLMATSDDGQHTFVLDRFAGTSAPSGTEAILTLKNSTGGLRPGGLLPVTLERPAVKGSVAIPYSALYGSDTVYRMTDEGRMARVQVKRIGEVTGPDRDNPDVRWVLIAGPGLEAGQSLITTHLPNAMSGLKVQWAGATENSADGAGE